MSPTTGYYKPFSVFFNLRDSGNLLKLLTYNRMLELVEGAAKHGRAGLADSEVPLPSEYCTYKTVKARF